MSYKLSIISYCRSRLLELNIVLLADGKQGGDYPVKWKAGGKLNGNYHANNRENISSLHLHGLHCGILAGGFWHH